MFPPNSQPVQRFSKHVVLSHLSLSVVVVFGERSEIRAWSPPDVRRVFDLSLLQNLPGRIGRWAVKLIPKVLHQRTGDHSDPGLQNCVSVGTKSTTTVTL